MRSLTAQFWYHHIRTRALVASQGTKSPWPAPWLTVRCGTAAFWTHHVAAAAAAVMTQGKDIRRLPAVHCQLLNHGIWSKVRRILSYSIMLQDALLHDNTSLRFKNLDMRYTEACNISNLETGARDFSSLRPARKKEDR